MNKRSFGKIIALLVLMSGCSQHIYDNEPGKLSVSEIQGLSDAALAYGAQSGLAWQTRRINNYLELHARKLDQVYDFNQLMLKNNLMPPVVQESRNHYHQDNYDVVRLADRVVEIVMPASLVTTPPSWRDYLVFNYSYPKRPHNAVLPKNGDQRAIWDRKVSEGWHKGTDQANTMFEEALGRLNRDIIGMVYYRNLLAQKMISEPITSTAELGVTGDDNRMRINDQIIRVTAPSKLRPKFQKTWDPAVVIDLKGKLKRFSKGK